MTGLAFLILFALVAGFRLVVESAALTARQEVHHRWARLGYGLIVDHLAVTPDGETRVELIARWEAVSLRQRREMDQREVI